MPRAIWSGSISFGLVSIPVKLFSAVSEQSVRFNQLDGRNNARVRQRRVNEATGEEVPHSEIVKGYELGSGRWITITDDDLAQLMPEQNRLIELEEFVDLDQIDPVYYSGSYWLGPADAAKPYALLATALHQSNKVGLGRFVLRSNQHLAVVRSVEGCLMLSLMVWADEVNPPEAIPGMDKAADVELNDKELAMATSLIESLTETFEPEKYHDTYRQAVLELIDRKADGEEAPVPAPADDRDDTVVDLMAALEASVAAAKKSRRPKDVEAEDQPAAESA
ncbi:Ku protein [Candidatus Neomicrothrix sp.]|uniref:non-homologous end joining protein Ku n=1 Tax=Candidatus Neomicrothrix sp. TaxID=2719034 RepID=UPI001B4A68EB|nr:Ku protein [Candidatus Microthrix sp.]MBP6135920.1 Ku protein [Candidatus Microthrix sp.]MBP6149554.1 Ku protein [Candidatus Microthrix sp.]MBP7987088.1 Ku protein [Candidatus Microthrix sp.]